MVIKFVTSKRSFDIIFVNIFFHWGLIVHRLRWIFFIAPFLITAFLAIGFRWIHEQTSIDPQYIFSPEDANWRYERAILSEYWPLDEQHFWPGKSYDYNGYVDVIVSGLVNPSVGRRPNMLLQKYIDEVDRLNKVKITYPIGWRGTEPIYFGALVGGVHIVDDDGHFDYAKAVRLTYNVRDGSLSNIGYAWRKKLANFLLAKQKASDNILDFGFYHNESLPEGLQDVANTLTPKFALCSLILFAFCLGSSIVMLSDSQTNRIVAIDWVRSKPTLGVAALVCPILAVISGFGFLLWLGVLYNAIVNVSPFIVLCIGIDDAFIMSAAWHRTNPELSVARRLAETLAEAAVAISITSITDMMTFGIGCFTTLPGVRLFCMYTFWGVTFTYLYQITYFSAVIAIAGEMENSGHHSLFLCKALRPNEASSRLQLLLFTGSICRLDEHIQSKNQRVCAEEISCNVNRHMETNSKTEKEKIELSYIWLKLKYGINVFFDLIKSPQHKLDEQFNSHHERETLVNHFFREIYGPFLLTKLTKFYVLILYLFYFGTAIYGLTQIEEGLNPKNLVRSSFYLTNFYVLIDETFWQEGLQMQVVINSPPDLFDMKQRTDFSKLLASFEGTKYTMNHNATMLWLNAYETYLQNELSQFNISLPKTSEEWYNRCEEWLLIAGGRRLWELDMVWSKNTSEKGHRKLKAFRFQIGLRNYRTPTDHTESCRLMREISRHFLEYNITTFHEYYPFADQYIELKPALFRNCLLALLCMAFVSLIMIPNVAAAFVIVASIVSIDLGVLGYMALWGVNFESVSMITVIMSIGFSVDLSAHITYGYVKANDARSPNAKALASLETLGWPVFLGAFSTVIGIMVLAFVDAYIVQIFFKTTFLVITFSLLHGIVFLPILLTVMLNVSSVAVQK